MGWRFYRRVCIIPLIMLGSGCASVAPLSPALPAPTAAPPAANPNPPANVNLQGFPLAYRQGYADGCSSASSAERRDATRFKNDGQYRTGWVDGNAMCKKR